jgi:ferric-dicitrate binding protein FerR (iron transport regulator)
LLRLARGQVLNTVVNSRYEVTAPTGTAGAKGTVFLVEYAPAPAVTWVPPGKGKGLAKKLPKGKAETHVYQGTVYFQGKFTRTVLSAGQAAAVTESGVVRPVKQKPKP